MDEMILVSFAAAWDAKLSSKTTGVASPNKACPFSGALSGLLPPFLSHAPSHFGTKSELKSSIPLAA